MTVPSNFASTTVSANFQAKQIDSTAFYNTAGTPNGQTAVGTTVYNLKALADATTVIPSFDSPLTVTLTYSPSDIGSLDESSLKIYRYDGSTWNALSNCSVDTNAHTVTCSTSNFSDFAIFGSPVASPTPAPQQQSQGGGGGGGSISSGGGGGRIVSIPQPTQSLIPTPTKKPLVPALPTLPAFHFTKLLKLYTRDAEVKSLQQYLNAQGYVIAKSGLGSPGKETELFGAATKAALIRFQKAHKIPATGQVGVMTRAALNTR